MKELSEIETRVLASLYEKEVTTPEYYPMTLNSLVNACNQKSNRDPVVNYDAATVNEALAGLKEEGLISLLMGGDSRVPKYRNYFAEGFELTTAEAGLLNVLMLRGPQTLGELRTRAARFYDFAEIADVEIVLEALQQRTTGALVISLPRQTGQKEARYAHLLAGEVMISEVNNNLKKSSVSTEERLQKLETQVAWLYEQLADLLDGSQENISVEVNSEEG